MEAKSEMAYLLLYVDDIILTTSSRALLHSIVSSLTTEFSMKDLGHFASLSWDDYLS